MAGAKGELERSCSFPEAFEMSTKIKAGVKIRTKAFAIAVLLLAGLSLAHSISTDPANSTQKKPKFDAAAKEEGEATPFTPMSQHQQEHARLYGSESGVGKRLTDLARERGEDVTIGIDPPLQMIQPEGEKENGLESLARRVDAIVVASVKDKTSLFNEGETFVFTEHKVRVEEVIKHNTSAPIDPGSESRLCAQEEKSWLMAELSWQLKAQ